MTAITLNLLAEEQLALQAEARDPFKLTLAVGLGLCMIGVVAGSVFATLASKQKSRAAFLQSKLDALAAGHSDLGGDTKSLKAQADDILAINQGRRLYAQQLAFIKDVVPDTIQLDQIAFTVSASAAVTAPPDAAGADGAKPRARRNVSVERLSLTLSGQAISSRPEIEVDQFIQTMRASEAFSSQLQDIRLRAIARNAMTGDARSAALLSASFVIDCQYKERR